jgi:hypothetical protein
MDEMERNELRASLGAQGKNLDNQQQHIVDNDAGQYSPFSADV